MKTKYLIPLGLLLALSVMLGGCATGLLPSAWPGMTVDDGYVYVSGGSFVYAVNLETGAEAWRFPEKANQANPFFAAPVMTPDGQLIVGGYDHKLYSLNPQTGAANWQFEAALDRWIGSVLVVGDVIYAPNADYKLYAFNLAGGLLWEFTADQSIWGAPVSDGQRVFFGTLGRKVYAVDAGSGEQVWVSDLDGAVLGSPVLGPDGSLYVGTYNGDLVALNAASGAVRWQQAGHSWIWAGPTLEGGRLYFGDGKGSLFAYETNGRQVWNRPLNGAIVGSPLVDGGEIVIGTETGTAYFTGSSGQDLRPIAIPGKVYASPAAAGDLILVAPTNGDTLLIALDRNGAQKWSFTPAK